MSHKMSPNVKASMRAWDASQVSTLPMWAIKRAAMITGATVPQSGGADTSNVLYCLPAGLSLRLTTDIAKALVEEREACVEGLSHYSEFIGLVDKFAKEKR